MMLTPSSQDLNVASVPIMADPATLPDHGKRRGSSTEDVSAATPPSPAKRFQVPRACRRCKSLRRGCSEYRPCKRCIDAGVGDQCLATTHDRRASMPADSHRPEAADALRRMADLVRSPVLDYCVGRFFERLHPTIPILTPDYVARLKATACSPSLEAASEACCALVAMCAQVLLQAEEPENLFQQRIIPEKNQDFGRALVDMALTVHCTLPRRPSPTLDQCLLAFFLYACQARLSHHSQAFLFLREATTLFLLLRTPEGDAPAEELADRLFWVLLISERSHAIRYRRPITLQISASRLESDIAKNPSLAAFWSLASLFRPIDTAFIAYLNEEVFATAAPTPDSIDFVETAVNTAVKPIPELLDTQKANLRVTQLWLRVIIWQLRLRLGYLREESYQHSLTYQYPLDIAKDLMLSTRDLPIESIKVHGVGLTEKLFDVASAVVDVLARVPLTASSPRGPAMGTPPEDDLVYLRHLIVRLPGGSVIYDDLLDKHIQQALPGLVARTTGHRSPP